MAGGASCNGGRLRGAFVAAVVPFSLAFRTRKRSASCTCSGKQRARRSGRVRASRHAVARLLNAAQLLPPAIMGKGPLEVRAGRAWTRTTCD